MASHAVFGQGSVNRNREGEIRVGLGWVGIMNELIEIGLV